MKKWIRKISALGTQSSRNILGLMSGTSMDGIDMALCRLEGSSVQTDVDVLKMDIVTLPASVEEAFHQVAYRKESTAAAILRYEAELTEAWCIGIGERLREWGDVQIDLIASHGQTLLHLPDPNGTFHATLQGVDGDHLAMRLGIPVVSDFRRKHIAAGYEGAPLAPLAESLVCTSGSERRALLNLGGIANFTILEDGLKEPVVPFATDCGPANTLMDETVRHLFPGYQYDRNGAFARKGRILNGLLETMLRHPFFSRPVPKSTGPEEFSWAWLKDCLLETGTDPAQHDLLATVTECTAVTVARAMLEQAGDCPFTVYVSGGGWNNHYLIERLKKNLKGTVLKSSKEIGLDPDMKEAILFAVLANETVAGTGWLNGSGKPFSLGKISLP